MYLRDIIPRAFFSTKWQSLHQHRMCGISGTRWWVLENRHRWRYSVGEVPLVQQWWGGHGRLMGGKTYNFFLTQLLWLHRHSFLCPLTLTCMWTHCGQKMITDWLSCSSQIIIQRVSYHSYHQPHTFQVGSVLSGSKQKYYAGSMQTTAPSTLSVILAFLSCYLFHQPAVWQWVSSWALHSAMQGTWLIFNLLTCLHNMREHTNSLITHKQYITPVGNDVHITVSNDGRAVACEQVQVWYPV